MDRVTLAANVQASNPTMDTATCFAVADKFLAESEALTAKAKEATPVPAFSRPARSATAKADD